MEPSSTPTVSCILIFFNSERFIEEAIESVVGQVGIDDWELLLVDDGSTDRSTQIARSWAARHPDKIRYLEHPDHANHGMSSSRNLGLKHAVGEYVAFIDSDDVWLPSMLAQRVRLLEQHQSADIAFGPIWEWFSWQERRDRRRDLLYTLPRGIPVGDPVPPPALFLNIYGTPYGWEAPGICSLMYRRQSLIRIGGFESSFRGMFEDQVIYVKTFLNLTCVLDPRPLALYRQHEESACATAIAEGDYHPNAISPAAERFMSWMSEYVSETCGTDGPEWQAVRASLEWFERSRGSEHPPSRPRGWRTFPRRAFWRLRWEVTHRLRRDAGRPLLDAWSDQFVATWNRCRTGRSAVLTRRSAVELHRRVPSAVHAASEVGLADRLGNGPFDSIIVLPDVARWTSLTDLLTWSREHLAPGGHILVLMPEPVHRRRPAGRRRHDLLLSTVRTALPDMVVDVETFGSRDARRALQLRWRTRRAGVAVDHHDSATICLTGVRIRRGGPPTAVRA